ncbi:MAG TPA: hypothetical protein VLY46_02785 [Usitatibacter sp.]|nr:hypothetical protein [Usitatibacter sp.]
MLLAVASACTYAAAVVLSIGLDLDAKSAREVYSLSEQKLKDMGFVADSGAHETDRYLSSRLDDPLSPPGRPQGWHLQLLLDKDGSHVTVILVEPGATEPSAQLERRADEVLNELRQRMPGIRIERE